MSFKLKHLLIILIIIGAFLRFYNLNWGAPFYFHPDERNIATAVTQLSFPDQMNPHFFAYGSLPIYTIYFTGLIFNFFAKCHLSIVNCEMFTVNFEQAIITSRIYSALFSTILIPMLYLIGKKIKDTKTGLLTALFATFSTGFIQFAHFGTFEMWLTLFTVILFWLCLNHKNNKNILLIGVVFGVLMAIKVSTLLLLPIPVLLILLTKNKSLTKLRLIFSVVVIATAIYAIANPFVFIDTQSFISSMRYESSLAVGTLPVFYTQGFYATIPVLFQFHRIFPFLINPLLTIVFVPAFLYLFFKAIKTKNLPFLLLTSYFLLLFIPQAVLLAKWTRYMVPTLPFIYLIISIATIKVTLENVQKKNVLHKLTHAIYKPTLMLLIFTAILFSASYFKTVFIKPDSRLKAFEYVKQTIPSGTTAMSEVYDLGIVPFERHLDIKQFNFYDLDNNTPTQTELNTLIQNSELIILPSQRIIKSRMQNKSRYPKSYAFYSDLINGKLGYEKIYQTPCDVYCKIAYLGDPVYFLEETATVFDRPTVFIYRKIQ